MEEGAISSVSDSDMTEDAADAGVEGIAVTELSCMTEDGAYSCCGTGDTDTSAAVKVEVHEVDSVMFPYSGGLYTG